MKKKRRGEKERKADREKREAAGSEPVLYLSLIQRRDK
jgi:hypothetical protein